MEPSFKSMLDFVAFFRSLRFDIVIICRRISLTPSDGGMENPVYTFATPTFITGDRANVDMIAHELAHSWSGNLVTNCSWEHFWLNEGRIPRLLLSSTYLLLLLRLDDVSSTPSKPNLPIPNISKTLRLHRSKPQCKPQKPRKKKKLTKH